MGEPVVVKENPSSKPGVVRFMTDRLLTGMGHERYRVDEEVWGERPPDVLARRLFARGGVDGVQVHGNMVTVDLEKGYSTEGLLGIIENMYVHYPENMVGADAPSDTVTPSVETSVEDAAAGEAAETTPAADDVAVPVEAEPVETPAPVVETPPAADVAAAAETEPDAG